VKLIRPINLLTLLAPLPIVIAICRMALWEMQAPIGILRWPRGLHGRVFASLQGITEPLPVFSCTAATYLFFGAVMLVPFVITLVAQVEAYVVVELLHRFCAFLGKPFAPASRQMATAVGAVLFALLAPMSIPAYIVWSSLQMVHRAWLQWRMRAQRNSPLPRETRSIGLLLRAGVSLLVCAGMLRLVVSVPERMAIIRPLTYVGFDRGAVSLALGKILSDAQVEHLGSLFDAEAFAAKVNAVAVERNLDAVAAAIAVYSTSFTDILNYGRGVAASDSVFDEKVVKHLSQPYDAMTNDPWGSPYSIVPSPWPDAWGRQPWPLEILYGNSRDGDLVFVWSTHPIFLEQLSAMREREEAQEGDGLQ
jgi:hypothetical protein